MSVNESTVNANSGKTIRSSRVRTMCGVAMLSAVAYILQFLEFPLPMLIPSFIKLDFSELPALIGAFAYGPVAGVVVCFIKNVIHLVNSQSGGVGELSNFLLGAVFVYTAGLIYRKSHSRKGAIAGSVTGAILMAVLSIFINYYIVYPIYTAFMPMETIIGAYQAILPTVKNLWQCLIVFNLPFTFVKGMLNVLITFLIYKPLSPILKGRI